MRFENEFEVAGTPGDVIEKLADTALMASLVPGASVGPPNPDGSYPGVLVVSFGPKRIAFKGTVTHQVDHESRSGVMSGKASSDVRGARMAVTLNYSLSDCPGSSLPRTRVKFVSEAQLAGVLAEFAKTGGVVLMNALVTEFAQRFTARFGPGLPSAPPASMVVNNSLSTTSLAAQVIRLQWAALTARIWKVVRWRSR